MREVITIPLTKGFEAVIDHADLALVDPFCWHASVDRNGYVYAVTTIPDGSRPGKYRDVRMHRYLLGEPPCIVDHRDRDTLNNRRRNLRCATHSQNMANQVRRGNGKSSKYKGVTYVGKRLKHKPWTAQIRCDGKLKHLGCFESDVEAAEAYDAAATHYFGEFAKLNFENGERFV